MSIAARNAMLAGGGGGLSAKSYVQDGLVAMWDGIENAGFGIHDSSAATWVDLAGSRDMTVNSSKWSDNSYALNSVGEIYRGSDNFTLGNDTYEIVLKTKTNNRMWCAIAFNKSIYRCLSYWSSNTRWYWGYKGTAISLQANNIYHLGAIYDSSSSQYPETTFLNGEQTNYPLAGDYWSTLYISGNYSVYGGARNAPNAEILSLRIYNRALTAAEIAANYAVDAARFNLTTS